MFVYQLSLAKSYYDAFDKNVLIAHRIEQVGKVQADVSPWNN